MAMTTMIGLFDNPHDAQEAITELVRLGFDRESIGLVTQDQNQGMDIQNSAQAFSYQPQAQTSDTATTDENIVGKSSGVGAALGGLGGLVVGLAALAVPGAGPVLVAGPLATLLTGGAVGAAAGGLIGALAGLGLNDKDSQFFAESLRRGGTIVTAEINDSDLDRVGEVFQRHGAIDIDERMERLETQGFSRFDSEAVPYSRDEVIAHRESFTPGGKFANPVIEENVSVGKRAAETGRVRLTSRIIERPVDENVSLREEHLDVERIPVDRPVTTDDMRAFEEEGAVEFRETAEQPVVSKEARVTEEILVNREVSERPENVRETARRTDAEIERDDSVPRPTT